MAKNSLLKKLHKNLTNYSCFFPDDNVLEIAFDEETPPFALAFIDPTIKSTIMISFSVHLTDVNLAIDLYRTACDSADIIVTETHLITEDNLVVFGEEARSQVDDKRMNIKPPSTLFH